MPKRPSEFRSDLLEDLSDPQEAAQYLNAAVADSEEMVLVALRDIAEARQMARIAETAGVAREAIYRMLRRTGNPTYSNFMGILDALGLTLRFVPAEPPVKPKSGPRNVKPATAKSAKSGARKSAEKKRYWPPMNHADLP